MKIRLSKVLLLALIPALWLLSNVEVVSAQDKTSLGVDPIRIELDLVAEESQAQDIKIYNLNNQDQDYLLYYEKFEIVGEEGKIKFLPKKEKEIEITFNETKISIPANSSKTVTANFHGAKNLPQSEYYYTIFVEPLPTPTTTVGSGSFVKGKIGILSYINFVHSGEILGELVKNGQIVEFSTKENWNFRSPVEFIARVNNTGTIHYNAYGTIKVKTQKGVVIETIVLDKSTILSGTIRILESGNERPLWNFNYLFGKYNAKLEVKSEDGTVQMSDKISFNILPLRLFLTIIFIIIIFITTLFVLRKQFLKSTNS